MMPTVRIRIWFVALLLLIAASVGAVDAPAQSWKQVIFQGSPQDLNNFRSQVSSAVVDAIPGYYLLNVPSSIDVTNFPGGHAWDNAQVSAHKNIKPSASNTSLPPVGSPVQYYDTPAVTSYTNQSAVSQISLPPALKIATGRGIRVAIIDTDVDEHNATLQPVLLPGRNYVGSSPVPDESNDPVVAQVNTDLLDQVNTDLLDQVNTDLLDQVNTDLLDQVNTDLLDAASKMPDFGHGTMMAGLVHLVAPHAQIIPLKAFDASGSASVWNIVRAVYDAVDMGADVINMSFSASSQSSVLEQALDFASARGVVIIAASGNDNSELPTYPAAYDEVLGISAVDGNDQKAPFSNYGQYIALSAPGVNIISTYPGNKTHPAGRWAMASGTSDSVPLVAGVAALVKQLTSQHVDNIVDHGVDPLNVPPQYRGKLGKGVLDAYKAVSSAIH
jgi:hypothetical protein